MELFENNGGAEFHSSLSSFYFYPTDAQLNIPEKNVKINIKSAPTCFGLNNHHQGAWHLL